MKWLAVSLAERVFVFRALPNGTDETNANFENVAPFFLNETFPSEWFRRATPFSLVDLANDIATLLATSPQLTIPGRNENINNFVPIGIDLASFTPQNATCLLATTILDLVPGQIAPVIAENYDVVEAFLNGVFPYSQPRSHFLLILFQVPSSHFSPTLNVTMTPSPPLALMPETQKLVLVRLPTSSTTAGTFPTPRIRHHTHQSLKPNGQPLVKVRNLAMADLFLKK